ncbi:MAG TPA: ketol-acid reductoisomerase [Pirellulaceae bacterium]|nr:ketol-acid reductoisomerase [Pirellulaceae bacterium]HMO91238.1 ketol-acid reductoisomerase [Pirellulaceae bacterium]HMP68578.1 ketol-acid reductoisomerase [Pirellulaceae bacterium]
MTNKFLTDDDLDLQPLLPLQVAVLGYGAQGRSHALNLRDSGISVIIGQRPGQGQRNAIADGFEPVPMDEAVKQASLIALLVPDEAHRQVFNEWVKPSLKKGQILLTCHGFSLCYKQLELPPEIPAVLVAPKAAGHRVRSAYTEGSGVACLVAAGPQADKSAMQVAFAYAKALGCGRTGVLITTVAEETEADLFGEQAVLCGGVSALVKAGFDTLVAAGYQEEVAYFECVHELKLVVDLLHRGGLAFMRDHISNTAEYGDYTRGPRLINAAVLQTMRDILTEIQSGQFAAEWLEENRSGCKRFHETRASERQLAIEQVGQRITQLGR